MLAVGYFHVVFTLPQELSLLALQNKKAVYGLLFGASAETLLEVAADPKYLGDWHSERLAYVGTESAAPPARSLCDSSRRSFAGSLTMGPPNGQIR
jgi:hypothetical protein